MVVNVKAENEARRKGKGLSSLTQEGLPGKMAFEQRPEGNEGASHVNKWVERTESTDAIVWVGAGGPYGRFMVYIQTWRVQGGKKENQ